MVFCNASLSQEKKIIGLDELKKSMEDEQNTKTAKEIQKCERILIGEKSEFSLKRIKCKRYIKKLCKISRNESRCSNYKYGHAILSK